MPTYVACIRTYVHVAICTYARVCVSSIFAVFELLFDESEYTVGEGGPGESHTALRVCLTQGEGGAQSADLGKGQDTLIVDLVITSQDGTATGTVGTCKHSTKPDLGLLDWYYYSYTYVQWRKDLRTCIANIKNNIEYSF